MAALPLPFAISADSDNPTEFQRIMKCVAFCGAQKRGCHLDYYSLDAASSEMSFWLLYEHPEAFDEGNLWRSATRAWWGVERRVLPAMAREHEAELPEDIAQQQDDSLASMALWHAMQRMTPVERAAAVDIIEGTVDLHRASGAQRRRIARVKAMLAEALAS
jgi:hypothetical protein